MTEPTFTELRKRRDLLKEIEALTVKFLENRWLAVVKQMADAMPTEVDMQAARDHLAALEKIENLNSNKEK